MPSIYNGHKYYNGLGRGYREHRQCSGKCHGNQYQYYQYYNDDDDDDNNNYNLIDLVSSPSIHMVNNTVNRTLLERERAKKIQNEPIS